MINNQSLVLDNYKIYIYIYIKLFGTKNLNGCA